MPTSTAAVAAARSSYLGFGSEPTSKTADGADVRTDEMSGGANQPAKIDLWDSDAVGGRYYWTVVPVVAAQEAAIQTTLVAGALAGATTVTVGDTTGFGVGDTILVGSTNPEAAGVASVAGNTITLTAPLQRDHNAGELVSKPGDAIKYVEGELTQDECSAHRDLTFGKASDPAVTGQAAPFASGLSPDGKLVAATTRRPKFYGAPLVAWQPTLSTDKYQVEWSRTRYPWRAAGSLETFSTSALLPLRPGTWFYRVRGLDSLLLGSRPELSWSDPVRLTVTKPRYRVVH
jgi:hypothetical protein